MVATETVNLLSHPTAPLNDQHLYNSLNQVRAAVGRDPQLFHFGLPNTCTACVFAQALIDIDPDVLIHEEFADVSRELAVAMFEVFGTGIMPLDGNGERFQIIFRLDVTSWLIRFDAANRPRLVAA